jgi:antitoxin MazE
MLVSVVAIGNSKGIRIPKAILEQCDIRDQIDLEVRDGRIVLEPVRDAPRKDWSAAFRRMARDHDDELLIPDELESETDDWEW